MTSRKYDAVAVLLITHPGLRNQPVKRYRFSSVMVALLLAVTASVARADVFNMGSGLTNLDFVTVGNAGNAADSTGYGAVDYAYAIGKYEVTAGQYTAFLNAVAATDTYGLYNTSMWTYRRRHGCKIQRSGSSGSYTYSVAADCANRPVNYVSFWDAARFVNWLHNGQGRRRHRERRVYQRRQHEHVRAAGRRQVLDPHGERVVQGGVSQERRRDGELLRLSRRSSDTNQHFHGATYEQFSLVPH